MGFAQQRSSMSRMSVRREERKEIEKREFNMFGQGSNWGTSFHSIWYDIRVIVGADRLPVSMNHGWSGPLEIMIQVRL